MPESMASGRQTLYMSDVAQQEFSTVPSTAGGIMPDVYHSNTDVQYDQRGRMDARLLRDKLDSLEERNCELADENERLQKANQFIEQLGETDEPAHAALRRFIDADAATVSAAHRQSEAIFRSEISSWEERAEMARARLDATQSASSALEASLYATRSELQESREHLVRSRAQVVAAQSVSLDRERREWAMDTQRLLHAEDALESGSRARSELQSKLSERAKQCYACEQRLGRAEAELESHKEESEKQQAAASEEKKRIKRDAAKRLSEAQSQCTELREETVEVATKAKDAERAMLSKLSTARQDRQKAENKLRQQVQRLQDELREQSQVTPETRDVKLRCDESLEEVAVLRRSVLDAEAECSEERQRHSMEMRVLGLENEAVRNELRTASDQAKQDLEAELVEERAKQQKESWQRLCESDQRHSAQFLQLQKAQSAELSNLAERASRAELELEQRFMAEQVVAQTEERAAAGFHNKLEAAKRSREDLLGELAEARLDASTAKEQRRILAEAGSSNNLGALLRRAPPPEMAWGSIFVEGIEGVASAASGAAPPPPLTPATWSSSAPSRQPRGGTPESASPIGVLEANSGLVWPTTGAGGSAATSVVDGGDKPSVDDAEGTIRQLRVELACAAEGSRAKAEQQQLLQRRLDSFGAEGTASPETDVERFRVEAGAEMRYFCTEYKREAAEVRHERERSRRAEGELDELRRASGEVQDALRAAGRCLRDVEEQASQLRAERRGLESRVQEGNRSEEQLSSEMKQFSDCREENSRLRSERRRAQQRLAIAEQAESDRLALVEEEIEERIELQMQTYKASEQQLKEQIRIIRDERQRERSKADKAADRLRSKVLELEQQEGALAKQQRTEASAHRRFSEEQSEQLKSAKQQCRRLNMELREQSEHQQETLQDAAGLRAGLGSAEQQALNSESALMRLATEAEDAMRGEEEWRTQCRELDAEIHAEEVALAAAAGRAVSQAEEHFQKREHKMRGEIREEAAAMEKQVHQISDAARKLAPLLGEEVLAQLQQFDEDKSGTKTDIFTPVMHMHVMQAAARRLASLEQRLGESRQEPKVNAKEILAGQEAKVVAGETSLRPESKDTTGERVSAERAASAALAASAKRERELNSQNVAMHKTMTALRSENDELKQEQQKRSNQGHRIATLQARVIKLLEENSALKRQQQPPGAATRPEGEGSDSAVPKPILTTDQGPSVSDYKKRLGQLQAAKVKADEEIWLLKRQTVATIQPLRSEIETLRTELTEQQQRSSADTDVAGKRAAASERRARSLEAKLRSHEDGRAALVAEKEAVESQLDTAAKQLEALLAEEHRDGDLQREFASLSKQFDTLHGQHREQLRRATEQTKELALEREEKQRLDERLTEVASQMKEAVDSGMKRDEELLSTKEALRNARRHGDAQARELSDTLSEQATLLQETEHLRAVQRQQQLAVRDLREELRRLQRELEVQALLAAEAQKHPMGHSFQDGVPVLGSDSTEVARTSTMQAPDKVHEPAGVTDEQEDHSGIVERGESCPSTSPHDGCEPPLVEGERPAARRDPTSSSRGSSGAVCFPIGDVDQEIERAFGEIAGPGSASCALDSVSSSSRDEALEADAAAPPTAADGREAPAAKGTSLAAAAAAATAANAASAAREALVPPRPPLPRSEPGAAAQQRPPQSMFDAEAELAELGDLAPPRRPIAEDVQLRVDSAGVWVRGVDQPQLRTNGTPGDRSCSYPASPRDRDESWLEALQDRPALEQSHPRDERKHGHEPDAPAGRESDAQALSVRASETFAKAETLCEHQRFEEAVPLLEHCLELLLECDESVVPPGAVAEVWAHLGIAHQSLDQVQKAVDCYSEAVELDSSLHVCFANLASLHAYLRRRDEACRCIHRALALDADNPTYLQILQQLATSSSAPAEALPASEVAEERADDSACESLVAALVAEAEAEGGTGEPNSEVTES